jgi:predicted dehydrogenase
MGARTIKVGIAGLGRSGWNIHAKTLRTFPEQYAIAATFDPDESRRRQAAEETGAKPHESFESLVADADVELVVVATPSTLHAPHATAALAAGKDVVCEKPLASNLADAERLVADAGKSPKVFAVFQNNRFEPTFQKVKEVIDSGVLGEIKLIRMRWNGFARRWDWQTLKKNGGGTLNNTGPHQLDQALQLFGDVDPEVVFADLQRMLTSGDAEDHFKIVIKSAGRPVIDMECSSGDAYPGDKWTVCGTHGGLRGAGRELWWKYIDPQKYPAPPLDEKPTADRSYNRMPLEFTEEHWKVPEGTAGGPHRFYQTLYETLTAGAPLVVKAESVLRQMRLIAKAKELSPV